MASNASATNSVSEASVQSSDDGSSGSHRDNDNALVLSAKYLLRSKGKKDLIQRLRRVVEVLRDDDTIEVDSAAFPSLNDLCQELIQYMDHNDKQVRLYTVSACMELFTIYAPDAPWSTDETLDIFRQTIRQLASLAHTTAPTQPHYQDYARILELLAEVKIGVILVEMTKEEESQAEALPVLADLFRTLLQSVRAEHPPEIAERIQATICGCFEEFHDGITLPTALLDEVLLCIGQGPRVLVVNPQKAAAAQRSKKAPQLPAHQVEQPNPSFLVASSIIRSSVDRLSTPIAALLNGLLNNDTRLVSESSISTQLVKDLSKPQAQDQNSHADVYNIVYELHRVAPSILTTVIGTLTNFLVVPEVDQRKLVIQLLGKLFVKKPGTFANQFRLCYRQWLERAQDKDTSIRLVMVHLLLQLILPAATSTVVEDGLHQVSDEAQSMLRLCLDDPSSEVRLKTIHGICDTAFRYPTAVSLDTWLAVGVKVTSKQKQERKDALTGLVQMYYRHFMTKRLVDVNAGGDDVPLEIVQSALDAEDDAVLRDRLEWIPSRVFECASWKDDADLQSRVWQAMDDMLLGSELTSTSSSHQLSSTARAVGLAVLVESLEENALSWLGGLLRERAKLQKKMSDYMDARSLIREHPAGSEESLTANANALDLLEAVASFTDVSSGNAGERNPVLEKFHSAKDKHIFRILSTIATPTHSTKARVRAFDELPKRVKSQGDGAVKFVKGLVRKCAMGDFLNQDIVHHCILLAQEFGTQGDWDSCRKFLKCIQLAAEYFPSLCGNPQCFQTLKELFSTSRSSKQKGIDDVVTNLSGILAKAAPTQKLSEAEASVDSNFRKDLLRLCRDGTPEQARHAIKTLAAMVASEEQGEGSAGFDVLLNSLTSSSVLSTDSERLVSVLAALSEFSEAAPQVMLSERGQKLVKFALDTVLLGKGQPSDDQDSSEEMDEADQSRPRAKSTTPQRRKSGKRKHLSPGVASDILDDMDLSFSCRKLCAAMEFLVSLMRSSIFSSRKLRLSQPPSKFSISSGMSTENIETLFETLCNILRDEGIPPNNSDRKECSMRQDRAALRQCAAINLFRLCDPRLSLNQQFLTTSRWHTLAGALLDDERVVRDRIMEELGLMLTGNGRYGNYAQAGQAMIPSFNFLAMVVLCTDGDHATANGNAANVGKRSTTTKTNALECVNALRKKYEVESEQARANGPTAEQHFERHMKVRLMPEYVVPYAFHLLACRKETPVSERGGSYKQTGAGAGESSVDDEEYTESNESLERALRKRLKWLLDPLVLSLGESADNISFLMRMAEKLTRFKPVLAYSAASDSERAAARLNSVCEAARKVLMSYVKKDVNLASFPGQIMLPGNLFEKMPPSAGATSKNAPSPKKVDSPRVELDVRSPLLTRTEPQSIEEPMSQPSIESSQKGEERVATALGRIGTESSSEGSLAQKRSERPRRYPLRTSGEGSHVHFSPEVSAREILGPESFGALSPIERKLSIAADSPGVLLDSGEKTRGTTPPSALNDMALMTATASVRLSQTVTDSSSSGSPGKRSLRSKDRNHAVHLDKAAKSDALQQNSQTTAEVASGINRKRASPDAGLKAKKKPRKASVPSQIQIVRHRPLQDNVHAKQVLAARKVATGEGSNDLDFDHDEQAAEVAKPKKKAPVRNKENSVQPRVRSSRRRAKI